MRRGAIVVSSMTKGRKVVIMTCGPKHTGYHWSTNKHLSAALEDRVLVTEGSVILSRGRSTRGMGGVSGRASTGSGVVKTGRSKARRTKTR